MKRPANEKAGVANNDSFASLFISGLVGWRSAADPVVLSLRYEVDLDLTVSSERLL